MVYKEADFTTRYRKKRISDDMSLAVPDALSVYDGRIDLLRSQRFFL
jgi:hypothetical protein